MADADREAGNRPNSSAVMSIATIRQGLKIRRHVQCLSHSLLCGTRRQHAAGCLHNLWLGC